MNIELTGRPWILRGESHAEIADPLDARHLVNTFRLIYRDEDDVSRPREDILGSHLPSLIMKV